MNQNTRRIMLIDRLLSERDDLGYVRIPDDREEQRDLLRSLMNVRPPGDADEEFLRIQDEYLSEVIRSRGITDENDIPEVEPGIKLWRGDITLLSCGAIVNAANSGMTGCYVPCHACIDNCIHTYAGIQLRRDCGKLMRDQGHEEPVGLAKVTDAYNLPCRKVIHTVGPAIEGKLTEHDRELLRSCYVSCLEAAEEAGLKSIAFCCISTGVFRFPPEEAARIAVGTVREHLKEHDHPLEVIFNVFSENDERIYRKILGC